jgi:hypothetical protein
MHPVADALTGWDFVGVTVPLAIAVGFSVMSLNPPEFVVARACFSIAAAVLFLKTAVWLTGMSLGGVWRFTVPVILFGLIGLLWVESWAWVARRQDSVRAVSTILRQPGSAIYCSDSPVRVSAVD